MTLLEPNFRLGIENFALAAGVAGFCHLLESNPGPASLVFPEDRFRMTGTVMVLVNADTNALDRELTRSFTQALKEKGFAFTD